LPSGSERAERFLTMCSFTQKVKNFKRAVIKHNKPFVESGLLTAQELEFIANGSIVRSLSDPRVNKLFRGDK
jgi:hypothetical protein